MQKRKQGAPHKGWKAAARKTKESEMTSYTATPRYAEMPAPETWGPTGSFRQVIDGHQGFLGVQQLWQCRETGETKWQFLKTVTAQDAL